MLRRLFSIASLVSLPLCLATASLWLVTITNTNTWTLWRWGIEIQPDAARIGDGEIVIEHYPPPVPFSVGTTIYGTLNSQHWVLDRRIRLFPVASLLVALPMTWLISFLRSWFQVRHRMLRRLCASCGYNLTGNVSGICPECGRSVPSVPPRHDGNSTAPLSDPRRT